MKVLAALTLVALVAPGIHAIHAQEWFDSPQFFPTDGSDFFMQGRAVADVDLDGDPDVIWVSRSEVKTLFNELSGPGASGRIEVGPAASLPTNWTVARPVFGDVDGDGLLDLVYGTSNPVFGVAVVFGDGTGGFAGLVTIPVSEHFVDLALGNFDADAGLEIVLARQFAGPSTGLDVRYLDWNGATFDESASIFLSQNFASLAVTDADEDGIDDVVAGVSGGLVQILPSVNGAPSLGASFPVLDIGLSFTLRAADMDDDGDEDLLATSLVLLPVNTNFSLAVLEKTAASTWVQAGADPFELPRRGLTFNALAQPRSHVGDWDGDGDLDVINQGLLAYFFENDGDNRFTLAAQPLVEKDNDYIVDGAGTADFDGDGSLDYFGPRALVYGDGTFRDSPGPLLGPSTSLPDTLDWDDDGDIDLIHRNGTISLNDGSGTFTNMDAFPDPPSGFTFGSVSGIIDDFDGDGHVDYLVRYLEFVDHPIFGQVPEYRSMFLVRGTPTGFLNGGPATVLGLPDDFAAFSGFRKGIDLDGDGDLDLLDAGRVWVNDGSGYFTAVPSLPSTGVAHAGDVEPDGDVDLLVFDNLSGSYDFHLLRNQGNGALVSEFLANKLDAGDQARLFDLDGDGDLDVVLPGFYGSDGDSLTVLENTGGSFAPPTELIGGPGNTSFLAFEDIDLDGHGDLVTGNLAYYTNSASGNLAVFRHTGTGVEFEPVREYVKRGVYALMDLDGDGDQDAISFDTRILNRFREGPAAGSLRQIGAGKAGTGGIAPVLGAAGPIVPGSATAELRLRRAVGGTLAFVQVHGLGVVSGPGHARLVLQLQVSGTPGEAGVGAADLPLPLSPSLAGLEFRLQAFVLDAGARRGFSISNVLELRVGT